MTKMLNFTKHFNELILTLYYILISFTLTFLTSYVFTPQIVKILSIPFLKYIRTEDFDFIFTNIFELFNVYIILSFYTSILFTVPIILYYLYLFIKPGLFIYEKNTISFLLKTIACFVCFSILFTYYAILPCILSFLLNLDLMTNNSFVVLKMEAKLLEYIIFLFKLLFIYCFIVFQIPTIFVIFIYLKQPKQLFFYKKRRISVVVSLLIGCIFSSPDLFSLFLISLPLIFLFEIIAFAYILKDNYQYVVRL